MIETADQRVKAWVEGVVRDAPVSFGPPERAAGAAGVGLYLLELGPAPLPREQGRPATRLQLCYLVTTGGESPERAHALLGALVFAAQEQADFEVELAPPPLAVWAALGVRPQPAFRLRVPVTRERPTPAVPRVTQPLVVRAVPAVALRGRVLGPGDVPIAQAQVALPSLDLCVPTDAQGRFHFASVPAGTPLGRLEVRARGEVLSVRPEELPTEAGALRIRLALKEA
ncbi:carboxypeptidase-like regulatory domain-containing protein [Melittangium boletus]|uniref:carboxypeptidase-like regulatory domain-containing protein n=1 Tax=Melittangium boletus TaxID=83453 RepID=UPI003DA49F17